MKKWVSFYCFLLILLFGKSGFTADLIEEQGYLNDLRSVENGIVYSDNYGSAIYITRNGQMEKLTDTRGSGLFYSISPKRNSIGFKDINNNGQQRPALVNINNGEIRYLSNYTVHAGQPSFMDNGTVAFTLNTRLVLSDGREYELGVYSNIAPVSPDGKFVCYNDDNDQLWLLDLSNSNRQKISTDEGGYYYPQWSGNSHYILYLGFDSKIWVYNVETGSNTMIAEGHEPKWSVDASRIIFYKKEIDNFELINSDLYIVRNDGSEVRRLTNTEDSFEMDPEFSLDDSQIIYHKYGTKEIYISDLNTAKSAILKEQVIKVSISDIPDLLNNYQLYDQSKTENEGMPVPYLHQVYDVSDWFWGYYACAPTAATMLLAYHNILPKWPVSCTSPYRHTSNWGRYICERYYFHEKDYNYSSSPNGHTAGKGGYGYMWGTGGSPNSRMADYYRFHGMSAEQEWSSTSWNRAVNNINAGNPYTMCVWLTTSGHLVLGKGTVEGKKTLIFNDPYGNKNTAGYPSYDGEGARYDWPGYNEGNVNLATAGSGIPWTIATTYTTLVRADTLVDDKHVGNGFYLHAQYPSSMSIWKDKKSGYQNHYWYCSTHSGSDVDTSYAEWTPELPHLGWYNIYAYIPANTNATTNALYQIYHSNGIDSVVVDQSLYADEWVCLGEYICHSGTESFIHLGDACGEIGKVVLFDAVKWSPDRPVAIDFIAEKLSGAAPLTVQCTNLSEYLHEECQTIWDFGDGNSSELRDPLYIYREAGDYDVQLTVIYSDTIQLVTKPSYIHVDPPFSGDFSLIVPEVNSVLKTATPLFYWVPGSLNKSEQIVIARDLKNGNLPHLPETSGAPIEYQLYLHTNSDFNETTPIVVDTNFYKPETPLDENQEYFWQIRYVTASNDTLKSAVWSFSVDTQNSPPESFALIHPAEGEILTDLLPQFEWELTEDIDVNDSVFYRMKIGSDFTKFDIVYEGNETTVILDDTLADNHEYYWQVEAIDQADAVTLANGKPTVFFTNQVNETPKSVVLISPKNSDYVFTNYPTFEWLPADDPDPNEELTYFLRYWPVGSVVRYVYSTDTTYCDIRRVKYDYDYYWCVEVEDSGGLTAMSDTFIFKTSLTGIDDDVFIPTDFALYQNIPNPFNPTTSIVFDIPEQIHVHLTIYDLTGRLVRTLINSEKSVGTHRIVWDGYHDDGRLAAASVYVYRIHAGSFIQTKKMVFVR